MDCFVASLLAMTANTDTRSRSRGAIRPRFAKKSPPLKQRAWGMPDARCTRSLVCAWGNKYAHEYSQRAIGKHPTFPHAMVYGLYRALPGDRLSCHRRLRSYLRPLDTSVGVSGPHVFAVRCKQRP